jgi:hypothetical protein
MSTFSMTLWQICVHKTTSSEDVHMPLISVLDAVFHLKTLTLSEAH